jgi:transposase-like protein
MAGFLQPFYFLEYKMEKQVILLYYELLEPKDIAVRLNVHVDVIVNILKNFGYIVDQTSD